MNHTLATSAHANDSTTGHESPEVDLPRTILAAVSIAAMIFISAIVSQWLFYAYLQPLGERTATPLSGEGLVLPPSPQLEGVEMMSGTPANIAQSAAARQLQTYGWTDRDKRLIRVPIDQAMQIAIERNWLPSRASSTQSDASTDPNTPAAEKK